MLQEYPAKLVTAKFECALCSFPNSWYLKVKQTFNFQVTMFHRLCVIVVLIFCCLNMIKEVVQLIQQVSTLSQ